MPSAATVCTSHPRKENIPDVEAGRILLVEMAAAGLQVDHRLALDQAFRGARLRIPEGDSGPADGVDPGLQACGHRQVPQGVRDHHQIGRLELLGVLVEQGELVLLGPGQVGEVLTVCQALPAGHHVQVDLGHGGLVQAHVVDGSVGVRGPQLLEEHVGHGHGPGLAGVEGVGTDDQYTHGWAPCGCRRHQRPGPDARCVTSGPSNGNRPVCPGCGRYRLATASGPPFEDATGSVPPVLQSMGQHDQCAAITGARLA